MGLLDNNRVQERFWVCAFLISVMSVLCEYVSSLWSGEKEDFCVFTRGVPVVTELGGT